MQGGVYCAVAAHERGREETRMGARVLGVCAIQIWQLVRPLAEGGGGGLSHSGVEGGGMSRSEGEGGGGGVSRSGGDARVTASERRDVGAEASMLSMLIPLESAGT